MLVNNVDGEQKVSSMLKNSSFYIEVAKFVQAYTTIIKNPNEFLQMAKLQTLVSESDKLSWEQLVTIMQTCDLGFNKVPTAMELVVYYNYALEMGSIEKQEKRIATVEDVANAQKHYYNFIDEAKDRAEENYIRQKRISDRRDAEVKVVDDKLLGIKVMQGIAWVFMMFAVAIGCFGLISFFEDNLVVQALGGIVPVWEKQYVGAILLILIAFLLFALFDRFYIAYKKKYLKLAMASETIFTRSDDTYVETKNLKKKLDSLKRDLKVVKAELADKSKRFDVKKNIEMLIATNKIYKQYAMEESFDGDEKNLKNENELFEAQEFAPIKLTKEQSENLREVTKEAIRTEGQFDVDAYNEKFENVKKEEAEKQEETQQQEAEKQEEELLSSIDYIKQVLGFGANEAQNENAEENQRQK